MFKRILIVCVGNICRSPTAEFLFSHHLAGTGASLESAGLGALVGKPMDATALQVLSEHGVDGSAHEAQQLNAAMLRDADLVLAMEREHVTQMMRMAPEASGKVMLLDRWGQGADIPDPYRQSREAFDHVYGLIDQAVRSWLPHLRPNRN
ncbi:low molecular weight protein-tyrosine-phosphatase [Dyella sp. C9]|uniref:low molecular weight protein-tyrosine-phosphatase n=1 Tax=Dyella sp. C9 TaxID=2202154 RepID=UPI000DEFCBB6|nr:low molecular weight protein-tyrosine-phosphatase [Dyella sp. C9]